MKIEEVVKELEDIRDFDLAEDAIGREAIQEAIKAFQKQIPKKPIKVSNTISKCKRCGYNVKVGGRQTVFDYCDVCGQAIDWSDFDDE